MIIVQQSLFSSFFFAILRPGCYRGDSACIIVFDKSDRESFDEVPNWLSNFRKHIDSDTTPTIGMNAETIQIGDVTFSAGVKGYKKEIRSSTIPVAILGINSGEEEVSTDEGLTVLSVKGPFLCIL
ncbi:MAG: hypothetical protein ACW97Z_17440 [Candidatus Hodarchaeales archaeon]